ncbi:hypothetical protein ACFQ6B_06355 [Streptomyces wedmorensis]|uniref:Uncharacterized protein n=1 Tax=Streptomyces wedmorensis TaxID=43759 RepID=A0ABW6J1U4_STRWE
MSFLHEEYGADLEIYRKPLSTEVVADCDNPQAHKVLIACGFVEKVLHPYYVWHQLPEGLSEEEQKHRAPRAVCLLRAQDFDANIVEDLISEEAVASALDEVRRHRISGTAMSSSPTNGATRDLAQPDLTTSAVTPGPSSPTRHCR